jgi:hypothetical protein
MKTGIVVNNYDPTFKNRCQIRVNGLHTQKVGGQYVIIDDDLPWALPGPNPTAGGNYSVPKVGDRVYVDVKDTYNLTYYGPVEIRGNVKDLLYDNAEDSDRLKVIAFSEDYNDDGSKEYMKIYYLPEKGLTIECNGNLISMPKYNSLEIKTKGGAGFSINTTSNDITIHTDSTVKLDCNEVKLTAEAEDKLILGSKLMEVFNNHRHFTSDGQSSEPIEQITPNDFSKKIKIG